MQRHGYTIDDMVAMAEARGVFYGDIQRHLLYGSPLPPLKHSVKWPRGSAHKGEQILTENGEERNTKIRTPDEIPEAPPKAQKERTFQHSILCTSCGDEFSQDEIEKIYLQRAKVHNPRLTALVCKSCFARLLPVRPLTRREKYANPAPEEVVSAKFRVAKCARCGAVFAKEDGSRIYVRHPNSTRALYCYICAACTQEWETDAKKASDPKA